MSHAKFISAIAALFIAVALVALVALAQGTGDPTAPKNGDYIPPEHCVTNPKIEGCREDSPDNRHTDSTTKPTILISCVALFTAVLMMAFGLTVTTTQKAIFEERLFQLCIALMGVSLAAILFLLST